LVAQAELEELARQLAKSHPGAAGSLREGLAETLTVNRLGVPPTLARTLRTTNPIVIWSREEGVYDVGDRRLGHAGLRAGHGYLEDSSTQGLRRSSGRPSVDVALFAV
jgi:hypothetical protein